jgi:hypothetical protein
MTAPLRGKPLLLVVLLLACGHGPGAGTPPPTPVGAAQTWTWDGVAWSRISGSGPEQRFGAAMTFDKARGVTVLFGGYGTTGFLGDTWTWDGSDWVSRGSVLAMELQQRRRQQQKRCRWP